MIEILENIRLLDNDKLFEEKFKTIKKYQNNLPIPVADNYAYNKILYTGLKKYPKRLENYLVALKQSKDKIINHLPIILDIEPVSRCNFSCIMCQMKDWKNNKRADDMKFEDFKNLIDSQYGLTEVKLQGIGEPLLHKDFFKMVEYLTDRYIWVRTTTNGSILDKNDNYKKLVDSKIGEVQISFDGATKEIFEKIRVKSNFEKVLNNVTLLNKYANQKNRLISRMWILIQNYNSHQIKEFVEIAKKMEFKRVTFSIGISDWGQDNFRSKSMQIKSKQKLIDEIFEVIQKNRDMDITFWDLQDKYDKNNLCKWPFYRAYIGSDMRISPCCMIANPDSFCMGDARIFSKEWNSLKYQLFRENHLNYNIPKVCKNCYKGF